MATTTKHPSELNPGDVLIGLGTVIGRRFATMTERGSDEERARWCVVYRDADGEPRDMLVNGEHRFNVLS